MAKAERFSPFLEPYANAFVNMNSLTLGLMGLYCTLTIAQAYAEKLGVNVKTDVRPEARFGLLGTRQVSFGRSVRIPRHSRGL